MSSIVMDERVTPPNTPAVGKQTIYIDQSYGPSVIDDQGVSKTFQSTFGLGFGAVTKELVTTNTSTTYSSYLSLQKLGLTSGTYIAMWKLRFGASTLGRNMRFRLTNNSVELPRTYVEKELKDSGTDIRENITDFSVLNLSGNVDIAIEFAPEQSGDTLTVYSAELLLYRAV